MSQIILDSKDVLKTVTKPVGASGQISIGTEYAGLKVTAYITLDNRDYALDEIDEKEKDNAGT